MLLIDTTAVEVILISITSIIGIFGVSAALEGYIMTTVPIPMRIASAVGGLMLIFPGTVTDAAGLTLVALVLVQQLYVRKKAAVAQPM